MKQFSTYDPRLTEVFLLKPKAEGLTFDRKSAAIDPRRLAEALVAFANADGGTLAIGIRDRKFEGINHTGGKLNEFLRAPYMLCVPPVRVTHELIQINNVQGEADRLLLLHVEQSERVHTTTDDKVFLRIGDSSKELNFEERLQLEYDKGTREFEVHEVRECTLDDLDSEVLEDYKIRVGFEGEAARLLEARGFATRRPDAPPVLRVAGILLFAKNPTTFLPSARIRFVRYEGLEAETGPRMNVIKQEMIEGPLVRQIERIWAVVRGQLRDFTALGHQGQFTTVPEYPEFAWKEAIVNAVTHRAYNLGGVDIQVRMFDDRLEVESPGRLPGLVRINNIRDVRYSRNSRIARALNDWGYVREFGEGIDRIYDEMKRFYLDDPEFRESNTTFTLTLRNNIVMRRIRRRNAVGSLTGPEKWKKLTKEQQLALEYAYLRGRLTTKELAEFTNRSRPFAVKVLDSLVREGLLHWRGSSRTDPTSYYELVSSDGEEEV